MEDRFREEITRLHAQVCSGLADPNRIMILYALHGQNRNVTELVDLLDLPQPTISRHLKVLRESGLVLSNREGRSIYYQLADERIIKALDLLRGVLTQSLKSQAELIRTVKDLE